jgi:hypothetical protein
VACGDKCGRRIRIARCGGGYTVEVDDRWWETVWCGEASVKCAFYTPGWCEARHRGIVIGRWWHTSCGIYFSVVGSVVGEALGSALIGTSDVSLLAGQARRHWARGSWQSLVASGGGGV